ncbi:MAG: hypothetical protein IPN95_21425 [Bacteroidetes bacterium]|nr:hypothetical protein [Bacteroidota bacterium]
MKTLPVAILLVLFSLAIKMQVLGQSSVVSSTTISTQKPTVVSTISFKEQCPSRQEHILAHPEQYKVLENGMVEVYAVAGSNAASDSQQEITQPQEAANEVKVAEQSMKGLPKQMAASQILMLPPAVQRMILEHQDDHEITKSVLTKAEFDNLRPDQKKTIETNPTLFTIK